FTACDSVIRELPLHCAREKSPILLTPAPSALGNVIAPGGRATAKCYARAPRPAAPTRDAPGDVPYKIRAAAHTPQSTALVVRSGPVITYSCLPAARAAADVPGGLGAIVPGSGFPAAVTTTSSVSSVLATKTLC